MFLFLNEHLFYYKLEGEGDWHNLKTAMTTPYDYLCSRTHMHNKQSSFKEAEKWRRENTTICVSKIGHLFNSFFLFLIFYFMNILKHSTHLPHSVKENDIYFLIPKLD